MAPVSVPVALISGGTRALAMRSQLRRADAGRPGVAISNGVLTELRTSRDVLVSARVGGVEEPDGGHVQWISSKVWKSAVAVARHCTSASRGSAGTNSA